MKLPVRKAIGATFAYFIAELATVIRIVWAPLLLMGVALAIATPRYLQAVLAISDLGPQPDPNDVLPLVGPMFASLGLMSLIFALGYPMIFSGVMRHVIRGEAPRLPFYLNFGADELRVLGTYILVGLMTGLVYMVGAIGAAAVSAIFGALGAITGAKALVGLGSLIIMVAFLGALLWFVLRMSLALPAAIGARTIGIAISWEATKGNVLRLFGFWLFWISLLIIVETVLLLILSPDYLAQMGAMIAASPDQQAAHQMQTEMMRQQLQQLEHFSVLKTALTAGLGMVFGVLIFGLWASALGVAYRYVAPDAA